MKKTTSQDTISHEKYQEVVNDLALLRLENEEAEKENNRLRAAIKQYSKMLFGSSSEKLPKLSEVDPRQLSLLPEEELNSKPSSDDEIEVPAHTRPKGKKKTKTYEDELGNLSHFPPELRREDIIVDSSCECGECGGEMRQISQRVTEKLSVKPEEYLVKRYIQPVKKCTECSGKFEVAKKESGVLPKSQLDNSFITEVLVNKFAWHLPCYRQSQMLSEKGLEISRGVLIYACNEVAKRLKPVVDQMLHDIRKCEVVQMDETPIMVADRKSAKGKKKYNSSSYFWPILGGDQIYYYYAGNRKHENVPYLLGEDFKGTILSDAYEAYLRYSKDNPGVSSALCWDHARRNFYEVKEDPDALEALEWFQYFYKVEADIKEKIKGGELTASDIEDYRDDKTLTQLVEFKEFCESKLNRPSVQTHEKLNQAFTYIIKYWEELNLHYINGDVPMSNIKVEQQIRNMKLGAKNWLFASSEAGAETIAIMNSLVCTCKMNSINIRKYFNYLLDNVHKRTPNKLTPSYYKNNVDVDVEENTK